MNFDNHPKNSCIVIKKKKMIYINVPKCASNTMKKEIRNKVKIQIMIYNKQPELENYYKFTFIREPITRFLSGYLTILEKQNDISQFCKELPFWKINDKFDRFENFCQCVETHGFFDCHIAPYSYFLDDIGEIDYYGCVETFESDKKMILDKIGIKSKNFHTNSRTKWNTYYKNYNIDITELTPKQLDFIKNTYKDDILLFNKVMETKNQ